jgi:replicative DNA helicase
VKHQLIFRRILDLHKRGEAIDRVTIANELERHREMERVEWSQLSHIIRLDR